MQFLRSLVRHLQQVLIDGGLKIYRVLSSYHLHYALVSLMPLLRVNRLRKRLSQRRGFPKAIALLLATLTLAAALGPGFYNQPKLVVGKIATQTIAAPNNAIVEDKTATEAKRKTARTIASVVWMSNPTITDQIRQDLQNAIAQGTAAREQVGAVPYLDPTALPESIQRYLRRVETAEWQPIVNALQSSSTPAANAQQTEAIAELRSYKTATGLTFPALLEQITNARQRYVTARQSLPPMYDANFLDIPEPAWKRAQQEILQAAERMLAQGIPPGLPASQLETAIGLNVQVAVPTEFRVTATKLLATTLRPTLVKDEAQSQLLAEKAALDVPPEYVAVRSGELIAIAGTPISSRNFLMLDYFNLSRRETNWLGLASFAALVGGAIVLFWQIEQRFHPKGLRNRDYWLVWLMAASVPALVLVGIPSTNLPAIALLMSTFYGAILAVPMIGLLGALIPFGMGIGLSQWFPSATGALFAAVMGARVRSREEVALLGLGVGIIQGTLDLLIGLASGMVWYDLAGRAMVYGLLGLAWSIIASGISPYLEHVFDVVTTIRLVELANPNRPLLKRLAAETPGTFQHTLFVANLAEAAARELGCNVELVRAGTLYHDIGKMHDPLGFIENQMGGPNKHDLINDPWRSAAIIKKHVTEGLVMARRARLPKAVQAFIPEHQGTMTIAYFYHQAQQLAQADSTLTVDEADFRYDGPAPQSRETGLLMLADSCEAALRSLKDATSEEALNMITKILAARWKDGQLEETGLTREEMNTIGEVFVRVWKQSNHQRIAYPKAK